MYKITKGCSSSLLIRSVVREQLLYPTKPTLPLNEALLRENISSSVAKDAIQFIVSGGAEYGLGAVTLPAAGAGLAVGPTVETIIDTAFAAKGVSSAVASASNIGAELGEYGSLWSQAVAAYDSDLASYYDILVKIVQDALAALGKGSQDLIEDIASALQDAIEDVIEGLVDSIKAGIKLVIPDATIGLAVSKAFEQGLLSLADNAFSLLVAAVDSVELFKDFVSDPSIAVDFFEDVFKQVIDLMLEGAKKLEDVSWVKAILVGGVVGGSALKKLGPAGLEKTALLVKEQLPTVLKVIDGVLTVLVPTAITAIGIFQILMRDDWKKKSKKKQLAASYNRKGTTMKITKRQLRRIIREQSGLSPDEKAEFRRLAAEDIEDGYDLQQVKIEDLEDTLRYEKLSSKAGKNTGPDGEEVDIAASGGTVEAEFKKAVTSKEGREKLASHIESGGQSAEKLRLFALGSICGAVQESGVDFGSGASVAKKMCRILGNVGMSTILPVRAVEIIAPYAADFIRSLTDEAAAALWDLGKDYAKNEQTKITKSQLRRIIREAVND